MDKHSSHLTIQHQSSRVLRLGRAKFIIAGALVIIWLLLTAVRLLPSLYLPLPFFLASTTESPPRPQSWSWSDIEPSRDLKWSPCFKEYQCARLDVPLDWLDPSENKRVVIAIIKLPASDTDDYRGAVLYNPGGPGGSGVLALLDRGKAIQKIIGRNHDLIGFDPRGIGATTPAVDCWPSRQLSKIWNIKDVGEIDSHPGMLYDVYARSHAQSSSCITNSGEIIKYVSTSSVARDMLEIVERGGFGKLKYWGFSYGTMLGGMFAALYPEKVDRLVSDGNVDYEEWTTCSHLNALHDTDKVMDAFYYFCHKAGPSVCDFYSSSPAAIKERLSKLQDEIKIHPVIVPEALGKTRIPEIITYSRLRRLMSTALYQPVYMFPSFAKVIAALENGDGSPFLEFLSSLGMYQPFSCDCDSPAPPPGDPSLEEDALSDDAFRAIMCTDGGGLNETVEEFQEYADRIMDMSKAAGAVNVLFRVACVGWTTRAKWAFKGPFIGNTSHPILYIANKADNVTPLRSARQNARGFNGSVILVQNSYGHTSLAAPSLCTAKHINAYFQNGSLPPPDTQCEAEIQPFETVEKEYHGEGKDSEIWSGLIELATYSGRRRPFLGI